MAVTTYEGIVRDGKIELLDEVRLPDKTHVYVVIPTSPTKARANGTPRKPRKKKKMLTADQLLKSSLVGMWADRDDIGDSAEFARELREQAQRRNLDLHLP